MTRHSPTSSNSQTRASKVYWQILFWATIIHFGLFGFILAFALVTAGDFRIAPIDGSLIHEFKIALASAMWISENSLLFQSALVAADLAAIRLLWTTISHSANRRFLVAYLCVTFAIGLIHVSAIATVVSIGTVQTANGFVAFSGLALPPHIVADLILVVPAILLLVGQLVFRQHRSLWGLCPECGYDLRASKDRCPECGTPIPTTAEVTE